jgi:hypothetical protein
MNKLSVLVLGMLAFSSLAHAENAKIICGHTDKANIARDLSAGFAADYLTAEKLEEYARLGYDEVTNLVNCTLGEDGSVDVEGVILSMRTRMLLRDSMGPFGIVGAEIDLNLSLNEIDKTVETLANGIVMNGTSSRLTSTQDSGLQGSLSTSRIKHGDGVIVILRSERREPRRTYFPMVKVESSSQGQIQLQVPKTFSSTYNERAVIAPKLRFTSGDYKKLPVFTKDVLLTRTEQITSLDPVILIRTPVMGIKDHYGVEIYSDSVVRTNDRMKHEGRILRVMFYSKEGAERFIDLMTSNKNLLLHINTQSQAGLYGIPKRGNREIYGISANAVSVWSEEKKGLVTLFEALQAPGTNLVEAVVFGKTFAP